MSQSTPQVRPTTGAASVRARGRRLAALDERWLAAALGAGALLLAFVLRLLLARRVEAPWIMGDELRYAELGKSFSESGDLLFREQPTDLFTLYGVVISPAWFADSMTTTYGLVKAINVALMTLGAVPFFFWARRLVSTVYAAVATALLLVLPAFVYTGLIMTESLFLPVFLAFAFALARTLERPTVRRQLITLGLAALATGVRTQGLVLFPVIATAIVLMALFDLRATHVRIRARSSVGALRPFAVTIGLMAAGALLYVVWKAIEGQSLASGLRAYATVAQTDYTLRTAALWIVYHLAEIGLSVAVFPACALIVLVGLASVGRARLTAAQRAFVAVGTASTIWFVVVAGTFASRFSLRVEERNMLYVQPLLILALMLWIALGSRRPRTGTLVATVVPVALIITLPFETLLNGAALGDTFAFVPLIKLSTSLQGLPEVRVAVALGAMAAALLFALVPRRAASVALPVALALFLVLSTRSVSGSAHAQSFAARHAYGIGSDPSWVDHALPAGERAAFIYSAPIDADPHVLWQTEFWNRDVYTVFNYGVPAAGFPGINLGLDPRTGRIRPESIPRIPEDYAVTDGTLDLAGDVVAESGHLVLRRLDRPVRLAQAFDGLAADGWMGSDAGVTGFVAPRTGRITIRLSRAELGRQAPSARATIVAGRLGMSASGGYEVRRQAFRKAVTVSPRRAVTVSVPVPAAPYRVQLHVEPTFDAAQLGGGDTRQLGAVVRILARS
jgi:hypothetical protein